MQSFTAIGLCEAVATALASFGFTEPTEIQGKAAPVVLAGKDAYLSSATGSGKTFAYLAPMLSVLSPGSRGLKAIIAAPTHDLAAQLFRECERLIKASGLDFDTAQLLGSVPLDRQLKRLAQRPDIVVGSAGRVRDLLANGHLDARECRYLVLDEADRLFEKESQDIACDILDAMPGSCAKLLVSATIPERTIERSSRWFRDAERVFLDSTEALRDSIEHWCFHSPSRGKVDFLRRFEAAIKPERCLIFASSNASIFTIAKKLDYLGFPAAVLKSDKDGQDRRAALDEFSSGKVRYLITTDLGARGLDIQDVSHVLSFDLPEEPSVYVHRAGRTGRAGKRGVSIALTDLVELKRASKIAVRYGFAFVCKILDSGHVHDIEPDNFFALAEEEETQRRNVKLEAPARQARGGHLGLRPGQRPGLRPGGRTGQRLGGRTDGDRGAGGAPRGAGGMRPDTGLGDRAQPERFSRERFPADRPSGERRPRNNSGDRRRGQEQKAGPQANAAGGGNDDQKSAGARRRAHPEKHKPRGDKPDLKTRPDGGKPVKERRRTPKSQE